MFGAACTGAYHFYPKVVLSSSRFLFMSWSVQSILVLTAYGAGYASLLGQPRHSRPIATVADMVVQDVRWGFVDDSLTKDMGHSDTGLVSLFLPEPNAGVLNQRLRTTNKYAVPTTKLRGKYVTVPESVEPDLRTGLMVLPQCVSSKRLIFQFVDNSPFKPIFDGKIRALQEHGFIDYWYRRATDEDMEQYFRIDAEETAALAAFRLERLEGAFYVLYCGWAVSFLAFVCELLARHIRALVPTSQ